MSVNFLNFFQLNENFTASELISSYNKKIDEIDKEFYSHAYIHENYKQNINKMYSEAKRYLDSKNSLDNRLANVNFAIDNAFSHINHFLSNINTFKNNWLSPNITNTNLQTKQSSYNEVLNQDESITVHEEVIINNNGVINKTIKSYKKYKDGTIENV